MQRCRNPRLMKTSGNTRESPSVQMAVPEVGYEALQSMLTGEYTEESTGARTIRQTGGKDRHSKVFTSRGPRDRRVRLSVSTAIRFYDLQDRLGFEQPSKAVEWLLLHCQSSIKALPQLGSLHRPSTCIVPGVHAHHRTAQSLSLQPYPVPDLKLSSRNIPPNRSSIDLRTSYGQESHLRDQGAHLACLTHISQTNPAFSPQTDITSVLDAHSLTQALTRDAEEGDPPQSSHRSSSAGSSSQSTASLPIRFPHDRLDEASFGSHVYKWYPGFHSPSTPVPFFSNKRRIPCSQYFSGVNDYQPIQNNGWFKSDASGSTQNCAVSLSYDEGCTTHPAQKRMLDAGTVYEDFGAYDRSVPGTIHGAVLAPAIRPEVCHDINTARNLNLLGMKGNNSVIGSSFEGILAEINPLQAVVADRSKVGSTADVSSYMMQFQEAHSDRSDVINATLVSNNDLQRAQIEQSLVALNANVADEEMKIYRTSAMNTLNMLSPSESNNINDRIMPIINGRNTAGSNDNLIPAAAVSMDNTGGGLDGLQQQRQCLGFDWALKQALL